ncbi:MAG: PD40 domain-containing protein [Anaerolineae bacterium]|nr:PD40 domain-containing protein [Anaerolineae bacterium]MCA9888082.1 PD40 domain-containing protein [Anaerolineae bacterium]MCA9892228.1 PD40 domain-containing protein [Anaerolineae bacterium]MCB9460870.1 PD40 domain-containing protein [Anaerolineaceae bacterium]
MNALRVFLVFLGFLTVFSHGRADDIEDSILVIVGPAATSIFSYDLETDLVNQIAPDLKEAYPFRNYGAVDRSYTGEYISFTEDGPEFTLIIQNMNTNTREYFSAFGPAIWSPNKNIFVTGNHDGDIVIYDIDEQRITHSWNFVGGQGDFTWSPNSRFLAFYSTVNLETGLEHERLWEKFIYILEVETGDITLIADESKACGPHSDYRGLEWSPDGERLAFSAQCAAGLNAPIYTIELNGFLTRESWTSDSIEIRQLTIADEQARHGMGSLAWSPDGETLIFINVLYDASIPEPYLYAIDMSEVEANGPQVPEIFLDFSDIGTYVDGPVWY